MGLNHRDEHLTHEIYWESLAKAAPSEVCERTGAVYSQDRGGYFLSVINHKYLILPGEKRMYCMRGDRCEEEDLRDYFFFCHLFPYSTQTFMSRIRVSIIFDCTTGPWSSKKSLSESLNCCAFSSSMTNPQASSIRALFLACATSRCSFPQSAARSVNNVNMASPRMGNCFMALCIHL